MVKEARTMNQKKHILVLGILAVLLLFFSFCKKQYFPESEKINEKITMSLEQLKAGNTEKGISLIFDALLLNISNTSFSEEMNTSIQTAADEFSQEGLAGNNWIKTVGEAFQHSSRGLDSDEAEKSSEIAPVAEVFADKLKDAQQMLQKGSWNKASELLLESLLLIKPR